MPAVAAKSAVSRRRIRASDRMGGADINSRLVQIELATVSSLRALQIDIDGDEGVPAAEVFRKVRAALR